MESKRAFIIETKHSRAEDHMERDCNTALQQIIEKQYVSGFEDVYKSIAIYGISFYRKQCKVKTITIAEE